ncbi:hypothetical protein [Streptomyces sp. NPDC006638]|uniref:hypothetical protein n=1 Tax=Streptomyces sp. NPDC006638 TaxID=3157183 RepID=UPI0033A86D1C
MPTLNPQVVSLGGLTPTYGAAVANTKIPCGERTFLHVKNTAGSPMTVTLTATGQVRGSVVADTQVTVPATSGEKLIGPITADLFAGAVDGLCAVTYSSTTSVTAAALRI